MRFFVIKQDTNLAALAPQLLRQGRSVPAGLERLRKANPHLGADSVGKGTVVLVPDSSAFKAQGEVPGLDSLSDFVRESTASTREACGQAREELARRKEQDKDLAKILKGATLRKRAADDTRLANSIEASLARMDEDADAARETAARLDALEQGVAAELAKLKKLLG